MVALWGFLVLICAGLALALYVNFKEAFMRECFAQRVEHQFRPGAPLSPAPHAPEKDFATALRDSRQIEDMFHSKFQKAPSPPRSRRSEPRRPSPRRARELLSGEEEWENPRRRDVDMGICERDLSPG